MTYQATLQVNNAIVFNDFTMQPHFRDYMLRVDGAIVTVEAGIVSASGTAAWGGITGTLSAQTDLQTALNGKANSLGSDDNYVTDAEKVVIGNTCLLYTSDAADDLLCVDLGGRRTIKKKIQQHNHHCHDPPVTTLYSTTTTLSTS